MKKSEDTGEIDALFQLAPPEFVSARNALVAQFKKAGRDDAAGMVKSLPKPSTSAWAVNQLYWRHRPAFDKLIAIGERFRQAQASRLAGHDTDIRALLNERRESLSEMAKLAAAILQKSSGSAPVGVMHRVTASLEALSAYGTVSGAPHAGRLTQDVPSPGFDALAALVPRVGDGAKSDAPSKVLAFQKEVKHQPASRARAADPARREELRKAQLVAAKAARNEAAETLTEARRAAVKAQAGLKQAATRAKQKETEVAAAEERLQKVSAAAHEAKQQARRAAVEAESAAQAVADAERAVAKAKHDLEALE